MHICKRMNNCYSHIFPCIGAQRCRELISFKNELLDILPQKYKYLKDIELKNIGIVTREKLTRYSNDTNFNSPSRELLCSEEIQRA